MRRRVPSDEVVKRAGKRSTIASAKIEGREVPPDQRPVRRRAAVSRRIASQRGRAYRPCRRRRLARTYVGGKAFRSGLMAAVSSRREGACGHQSEDLRRCRKGVKR